MAKQLEELNIYEEIIIEMISSFRTQLRETRKTYDSTPIKEGAKLQDLKNRVQLLNHDIQLLESILNERKRREVDIPIQEYITIRDKSTRGGSFAKEIISSLYPQASPIMGRDTVFLYRGYEVQIKKRIRGIVVFLPCVEVTEDRQAYQLYIEYETRITTIDFKEKLDKMIDLHSSTLS